MKINIEKALFFSQKNQNLLMIIFILPTTIGFLQRLHKTNFWFKDYDAISCAASRIAAGQPLYTASIPCPMQNPTVYVYPPYTAMIWEKVQHAIGLIGATSLYGAMYFSCLIIALGMLFRQKETNVPAMLRAPLIAMLGDNIVNCGNIAVIIHSAIAIAAIWFIDYPSLMVVIIILSATIKPVYLVYSAIFLFFPMKKEKLLYIFASIIGGITPFIFYRIFNVEMYAENMELIKYFSLVNERGFGFLNFISLIGINNFSFFMVFLYVIYATILVGSALLICKYSSANRIEKVWVGIAAALACDPRLMFYDVLTLAPALAVTLSLIESRNKMHGNMITIIMILCGIIASVLNSRGGQYGLYFMFPVCIIILISSATKQAVANFYYRNEPPFQ